MKTDEPWKNYQIAVSEAKSLANATPVDELPEHEQAWLRAK